MHIYKTIQTINDEKNLTQRKLAEIVGVSLGKMNSIIKKCTENELILIKTEDKKIQYEITEKGFELLRDSIADIKNNMIAIPKTSNKSIKSAVILADLVALNLSSLENSISLLKSNRIDKIIIVVGLQKENVISRLDKFKDLVFIENHEYQNSGSMNSFDLASKYIDEDFILIEDTDLFNNKVIKSLIQSEQGEFTFIVDNFDSLNKKYVQLKNGNIYKIGNDIHQFSKIDGKFAGITRVSYKLFNLIMNEYVKSKNPLLNYEYVLLDIARDFKIPTYKIST